MSHPQAPTRQPTEDETKSYATTLHRAAIFTVVVCPLLAALPPRKFDTYTIGLVGLTGFSANYLYRESRGHSILSLVGGAGAEKARAEALASGDTSLPTDRAREFQRQLKAQREAQAIREGKPLPVAEEEKPGVLQQVYYGSEKPEGWQERRLREDQKALAEGKGYGDIIMEQIWDVWTWGKGKEKEVEAEIKGEEKK